jgi:Ser/Thr protein kinase RdoA (MazF antagonist)
MPVFPTQYSTLKTGALNDHISKNYGLKDTSCQLIIRNVSDTYLLNSSSGKYIFKIYRESHRNLDQIRGELELLNILKVAGARVSYPVNDLQGGQIQQFHAAEGIRNGVLFSYAEGTVVLDMNEEQLKAVGREIAFIHNHTSGLTLSYPRKKYTVGSTLTQALRTLKPHFNEMPEEFAWLNETAAQVVLKLNTLDTGSFSYGYCHYDFFPKNFHFDALNQITFFDFDFAGEGYLVNDLMVLSVHFFLQVTNKRTSPEQAESDFMTIIEAYREVRNLSDEELAAIPYLGYMFWVFYMEFHYLNFEDWSNFFLTPKFTKERIALIKNWTARYTEINPAI